MSEDLMVERRLGGAGMRITPAEKREMAVAYLTDPFGRQIQGHVRLGDAPYLPADGKGVKSSTVRKITNPRRSKRFDGHLKGHRRCSPAARA